MATRCKFRIASIEEKTQNVAQKDAEGNFIKDERDRLVYAPQKVFWVRMYPVCDPDPTSENGRFFASTPAGSLQLTTVNPSAVEGMVEGAEWYVDLKPAA